jgi:NodT family efflux transporter outer membrane factor (OMF) lipoprotein
MEVPPKFSEQAPATPDVAKWWENFNDPQLNSLVQRAVDQNLDVKAASARLKQARAQYGVVSADRFPQVNTSASYAAVRTPGAGENNLWKAGFDAAWELDVFGGIRRNVEAATYDIQASIEDRRNVLVTLTSDIAVNYVTLRGFQRQIVIAKENIAAQRETLGVTRKKFEAGLKDATELDVSRAQALVETTESQLPSLEQGELQSAHRLAILLGQEPTALLAELHPDKPIPNVDVPEIPVGLPSDLLRRRPDVQRAERQLAASTARIGVATADLFPRFSLTGSLGLESNQFHEIFNYGNRFWSVGPSVSWPLLDWGRIRSNIRVQNALTELAFVNYQQVVLNSLGEVEDALVAYSREQVRRKSLAASVESNKRAVTLATQRYNAGLTDFLSVLDAQRALYVVQDQLVQSDKTVSTNLVALYKALGGGWESTEPKVQAAEKPQQQTKPVSTTQPSASARAHEARTGGLVTE